MNFSIEISSDSDDGVEIPFAERVAKRAFGRKNIGNEKTESPKRSKISSSAFSDSDSDLPSPSSKPSAHESVSVTPPPAYISPYRRKVTTSQPGSPLPDTEELLPHTEEIMRGSCGLGVKYHSSSSSISTKSSTAPSSSSTDSTMLENNANAFNNKKTKEDKEFEKRKKIEEKLEKQKSKDLDKQSSKALKEAEKATAKQTDKTEVHKYLLVVLDPSTVSSPPGSEILNLLSNPPDSKAESVFQFSVEKLPVPEALTWKRKVISYEVTGGQVQMKENWQEEGRALVFLSAEDLAAKVEDGSLRPWAENAKSRLGGKHVTLMVYNYNAYIKQTRMPRRVSGKPR